jgi:hypothetical protein
MSSAFTAESENLLRHGNTASAMVVERNATTGEDIGPDNIVVEFTVSGETRSRRASMNVSNAYGYGDGQLVTIYYDPAKPSHVRTEGAENRAEWQTYMSAIVLFPGFILIVCSFAIAWRLWQPFELGPSPM